MNKILTKWIDGILNDSMRKFINWSLHWWLSDRLTFSQHVDFLVASPSSLEFGQYGALLWIQDGHGLALLPVLWQQVFPSSPAPSGMTNSENKGAFGQCESNTTLGRWERLEHHMGHAGFPSSHCGGMLECVEAILDRTQTASSDWWAQGMFTPAQQNKHFFFFFF